MSGGLDLDRLWQVIDVGRGVLSELDQGAVLDRVLQTAQQLTGARYAALGVLDENRTGLEQFTARGIDDQTRKVIGELPRGRGVLGVLIDTPSPLRLSDVRRHAYSYGFPAGHPEMRTFLGVPILIRGEVWGNLYLTEKDIGEFDQADEDAVVLLASWAAIAIEHARLHEELRLRGEQLERTVRSLQATREITMAVGGETDLERVLELVVKRGRALVDASSLVILLVDGAELIVAATAGRAQRPSGQRIPILGSTSGDVLRRSQPKRIADVAELQFGPESLGVEAATTALLVPMLYRGRAVGVLIAFDHGSQEEFGSEHEEMLRAFAVSAAIAVASAQSVAAERPDATVAAAPPERPPVGA